MTLMKLRLDFVFTDLSQHFKIYLINGLCNQVFYSWTWVRKRGCKIICVVKLKVVQPQPKFKTRNFPNLGNIIQKIPSRLTDFSH